VFTLQAWSIVKSDTGNKHKLSFTILHTRVVYGQDVDTELMREGLFAAAYVRASHKRRESFSGWGDPDCALVLLQKGPLYTGQSL
jgi:hypothetical protein